MNFIDSLVTMVTKFSPKKPEISKTSLIDLKIEPNFDSLSQNVFVVNSFYIMRFMRKKLMRLF